MEVYKTSEELNSFITSQKEAGLTIGFVPTMGALHKGHLSLITKAKQENDLVVCSIFINPDQFNNPNDLENYPYDPNQDVALLEKVDCDIAFIPTVRDIYPEKDNRTFDFHNLDKTMEGLSRPGHFNGVIRVVNRLFNVVEPNRAYFGEKDFQQLALIKLLSKELNPEVDIIACPTIRDEDGIAFSSRNQLLNKEERNSAQLIPEILTKVKTLKHQMSVNELLEWAKKEVSSDPVLELDYFEIVDPETLKPQTSWSESTGQVACIAVQCNDVRLIDNMAI